MLGYTFPELSKPEKHARRQALDHYASIAQWSPVLVLLGFQVYHILCWIARKRRVSDQELSRPSSPYVKAVEANSGAIVRKTRAVWKRARWWAGEEVVEGWGWGTTGEWVVEGVWGLWLSILCVRGTGHDYLHLTKRFGIIPSSQLPLHYLLAFKSPFSPLQILTLRSHESLNSAHQILGRIITFFFSLHVVFYVNFFIQNNRLLSRLQRPFIICGLLGMLSFAIVGTTALSKLRKWNYRVFYVTHVTLATTVLPLLFFHVHHIRVFIWETLAIYILHTLLRMLNRRRYAGDVAMIPNTNLLRIEIPLAHSSAPRPLKWKAGQHVYVSLPHDVNSSGLPRSKSDITAQLFATLKTNPFTIASLPSTDSSLLLVARVMDGNTKALAALARSSSEIPVVIEGPYGAITPFSELQEYETILLVALGVGATFVVPIWRQLLALENKEQEGVRRERKRQIKFVWAVRNLAETEWAFPREERSQGDGDQDEDVMDIYVTRGTSSTRSGEDPEIEADGEGIELVEREGLLREAMGGDEDEEKKFQGFHVHKGRPNFRNVVDNVFDKSSGRVAVLVCGPQKAANDLRKFVGIHVKSGREVYWHSEAFGL
ncbi:hypothetical protein M501DRAFT_963800 [Patellaria atrata CBS 101060]|uniref:ferric-chelate reductase (NADPH) n=1 Tax=Patellaria atrata CBS 101060 TaxID=1346257 RepID=A0A9P4VM21_9PEZI|nr:hypothetical protein M501DRAFT_963800 [Patellaria atrata CBS 101060]